MNPFTMRKNSSKLFSKSSNDIVLLAIFRFLVNLASAKVNLLWRGVSFWIQNINSKLTRKESLWFLEGEHDAIDPLACSIAQEIY